MSVQAEAELLEQSPWFDADWYSARYPDVALAGLEPAVHYLRVGEAKGWRPCSSFDPHWYLTQYPDIAQAGLSPLLHFITHGEQEGRMPCELEAEHWDSVLWRQQVSADDCLKALVALLAEGSWSEASYAGFALGRWHAWQGDWRAAMDALASRPWGQGSLPSHGGAALLTVEALGRSGYLAAAWQALGRLQAQRPDDSDWRLAAANLLAWQVAALSDIPANLQVEWRSQRLGWINAAWRRHGLTPVEPADLVAPLSLDNLASQDSPLTPHASSLTPHHSSLPPHPSPLITVIVPAYHAAQSLPTALASLAAQRGVRLEVIVVDDASPDDTAAVAGAFAERDARFRVIRQPYNQGAYAARNRGLAEARGEFITVHDSDDWSHPDKLATQLVGLRAHPEWVACCSHWVRCSPELIFGRWRMEEGWVYRNVSSLMFRREVFETLGYWDRVRVEADTEYYYRIRAAYGDRAVGEVLPRVPLAFGRAAVDSLTAVGATHLVTQFGGVRADYREASQAWHRAGAGQPQRLYLSAEPAGRPFNVPPTMLP